MRLLSIPSPLFNPALSQPKYYPPHRAVSSLFQPILPSPSPSTSNVPSRFLQPPPPPRPGHRQYHATPVAPVVITSIHFTLKAGAGVVPKRAPREPHFRYGLPYARPLFLPFPPLLNPFPNSRDYRGGRGGGRVDSSSDAFQTRFLAEFFPEKRKNIDDFAASPR